jgi:hypothetical protein
VSGVSAGGIPEPTGERDSLTRVAEDGTRMSPLPWMPLPVAFPPVGVPYLVTWAVYLEGVPE